MKLIDKKNEKELEKFKNKVNAMQNEEQLIKVQESLDQQQAKEENKFLNKASRSISSINLFDEDFMGVVGATAMVMFSGTFMPGATYDLALNGLITMGVGIGAIGAIVVGANILSARAEKKEEKLQQKMDMVKDRMNALN